MFVKGKLHTVCLGGPFFAISAVFLFFFSWRSVNLTVIIKYLLLEQNLLKFWLNLVKFLLPYINASFHNFVTTFISRLHLIFIERARFTQTWTVFFFFFFFSLLLFVCLFFVIFLCVFVLQGEIE